MTQPEPTRRQLLLWQALSKLQAGYEAALPRADLWTLADYRDADACLISDVRRELRSRSRYEFANNPMAARVLNVWVDDVLGSPGPLLQVETSSSTVNRFLELHWSRYWRAAQLGQKLAAAIRSEACDGEAVALQWFSTRAERNVKLDVLPLEADRLAAAGLTGEQRADAIDGVELDPTSGEPRRYHILDVHPGHEYLDEGFSGRGEYYAAERVIHVYRRLRPEQHRGVPVSAPVLPLTGLWRKFLEAKVLKAQNQASITVALESDLAGAPAGDGDLEKAFDTFPMPNRQGLFALLPAGVKPTHFKTDGDSSDVQEFHRLIALLHAGCFSMPVGRATGSYSGGAYAAVRAELKPYQNRIDTDRRDLWEPGWLSRVLSWWWAEFRLTSTWRKFAAGLKGSERDPDVIDEHHWEWAPPELIVDPSREEEAARKQISAGLASRSDFVRVPDINQHDRRAAKELGFQSVKAFRRAVAVSLGLKTEADAATPADTPPGDSEPGQTGDPPVSGEPRDPRGPQQSTAEVEEDAEEPDLQACGCREPVQQAARLLVTATLRRLYRSGKVSDREYRAARKKLAQGECCQGQSSEKGPDLQANCGTGAGGFRAGNTCARGGRGGSGPPGQDSAADRGNPRPSNWKQALKVAGGVAVLGAVTAAAVVLLQRARLSPRVTSELTGGVKAAAQGFRRPQAPPVKLSPRQRQVLQTVQWQGDAREQALGFGIQPEKAAILGGVEHFPNAQVKLSRWADGKRLSIEIRHPQLDGVMSRDLQRSADGSLKLQNSTFYLRPEIQGQRLGARTLHSQAKMLQQSGGTMETFAIGRGLERRRTAEGVVQHSENGYWTWARLGYDGQVKGPDGKRVNVSTLMMTEAGRQFWKSQGHEWLGTFDVRADSQSMRALEGYLVKSGISLEGAAVPQVSRLAETDDFTAADEAVLDDLWNEIGQKADSVREEVNLQANCGTGAGGFRAGNTCAKGRGLNIKEGSFVAGEGYFGQIVDRGVQDVTIKTAKGMRQVSLDEVVQGVKSGHVALIEDPPLKPWQEWQQDPIQSHFLPAMNYQQVRRHPQTQARVELIRQRLRAADADLEQVRQGIVSIHSARQKFLDQETGSIGRQIDLGQQLRAEYLDSRERQRLKRHLAREQAKGREAAAKANALLVKEQELTAAVIAAAHSPHSVEYGGRSRLRPQATAKGFLDSVVGKRLAEQHLRHCQVTVLGTRSRREYATGLEVHMRGDTPPETWIHEVAHTLEDGSPIRELSNGFLHHRLQGSDLVSLKKVVNRRYGADEFGHPDEFGRSMNVGSAHYTGKYYNHGGTEILSMGLQKLYEDPVRFAQRDPEFFKFVVGATTGRLL